MSGWASAPPDCSAPARAQATTTIGFQGWAFEPQVVEASVKRFMAENPDIKVNYTPLDLQLYPEKMVALFNAGTQGDAFYVRDTHLGAWVEAGWMQPIDGMPKLAELNKDIYPATLETLRYKGKQYGVPYYGDIYLYLYDKSQLAKRRGEEDSGHAGGAEERRAGSEEGRHFAVPDPQGLQDQHRRARRVLVDGLRLGRPPVQCRRWTRSSRTRTRLRSWSSNGCSRPCTTGRFSIRADWRSTRPRRATST